VTNNIDDITREEFAEAWAEMPWWYREYLYSKAVFSLLPYYCLPAWLTLLALLAIVAVAHLRTGI